MHLNNVLNLLCLCVSLVYLNLVNSRSYNNGLIFYDLQTFQPFLPPTVSVSRGRGLASVKFSEKGSIWSTFGKPCECRHKVCGCCAGINVKQFDFNQKLCANVTFIPPSEEALLDVYLNGKPSSKYGLSVRNPAPFCIPVMMGIPMAMCVQMSDIAIKGNNLNMCMDFIVRLATTDLFEMHFQCMQMGLDGFQYIDKDGKPVLPQGNSKNQIDDDYYDYDAADVDAANEISNNANEEGAYDEVEAQMPMKTVDASYIVGLQQQMQQLQDSEQNRKEYYNLVTQINDTATPTSMVVEVPTEEDEEEVIAAITTAYGTTEMATMGDAEAEAETETEESETKANNGSVVANTEDQTESETESETETGSTATTTINSVNNDAMNNNYAETPTTAASLTTEGALNNKITTTITTTINGLTDAKINENNAGMNVNAVLLQNVATNYESDAFNATNSNINIETTSPLAEPTTIVLGIELTTLKPIASSETTTIERSTLNGNSTTDTSTDSTNVAPTIAQPVGISYRHLNG